MSTQAILEMIENVDIHGSMEIDKLATICYYLCKEIDKLQVELNRSGYIANGIQPD